MLNGKREGWIEVGIIVDGVLVDPETPLVGACSKFRDLKAVRKQLLQLPFAKREGSELEDGDIVLDFHRDEGGAHGGIDSYVLDPVAFTAEVALEVLPDISGIPHDVLLRHLQRYSPAFELQQQSAPQVCNDTGRVP